MGEGLIVSPARHPSVPGFITRPCEAIAAPHVRDEAKTSAAIDSLPVDANQRLKIIADAWSEQMKMRWTTIRIFHPEVVTWAEQSGEGILTAGIFALAVRGKMSVEFRQIKSTSGTITYDVVPASAICASERPCGAGKLGIMLEFGMMTSERSKREHLTASPELSQVMDRSLLEVIRLVDLTIAYDGSGSVGGPIDALQLAPDGRIKWFQKKNDCPENHR